MLLWGRGRQRDTYLHPVKPTLIDACTKSIAPDASIRVRGSFRHLAWCENGGGGVAQGREGVHREGGGAQGGRGVW